MREVEHRAAASVKAGEEWDKFWNTQVESQEELEQAIDVLTQEKLAADPNYQKSCDSISRLEDELASVKEVANNKIRAMREVEDKLRLLIRNLRKQLNPTLPEETEHVTTHCLDRAASLVCGDRAADYGPPSHSFACVAQAWAAYLFASQRSKIDGRDVANMMIIYKTIRDSFNRQQDNPDDVAGYAQIASWQGDPRVEVPDVS